MTLRPIRLSPGLAPALHMALATCLSAALLAPLAPATARADEAPVAATAENAAENTTANVPRRAPMADFELDDLSGDAHTLSQYRGQVVVLSFWATWCAPCLQELPFLDALYQELGDQGLVILAVSTDGPETRSQVRNVARRERWSMPVLLDHDGAMMATINPRGTQPFLAFIDRQGGIASTSEGYVSGDEIAAEATIRALLAE